MEQKLETIIIYWENGKENGNYCSILGLHWGYGSWASQLEVP